MGTIVTNESAEIIRIFNSAFHGITGNALDFCPWDSHAEIESINEIIYETLNNGVYRVGVATSQESYDEAFDDLEQRLAKQC